jgi:aspartate racemase
MHHFKILGILGGMGPLATVDLFKKIVESTDADCDQEHIRIIIDNNTSIPDRAEFLLNGGISPYKNLLESALRLKDNGVDYIIMPCNTAHYFYEDLKNAVNIPFLSMIEETAKYLKKMFSLEKKIGLLATEGTCKLKIYHNILEKYGIEVSVPTDFYQKSVTDAIYNLKSGIYQKNFDGFYETIETMKNFEVNRFILGCTELPVLFQKYNLNINSISPTNILAESVIHLFGKNIKK